MEKTSLSYKTYVEILRRELIPAMGCTEPIAVAYCAAVARSYLGELPEALHVEASGNIIKNVKSVVVPHTDGLRGIPAAAAVGALAGDENALLQVISHISDEDRARLPAYMADTRITVCPADSEYVLDLAVTARRGGHYAKVRIANEHTNIIRVERDGEVLLEKDPEPRDAADESMPDYGLLNVQDILAFADSCDPGDVAEILDRQIAMNSAISDEGLKNSYGANIGKVLLSACGTDIRTRARAAAAAGSDARMSGCELPVVINSGSGNQGMTASLPVIEYAKALGASRETLYRALLVSNLVTLHEKNGIGRLSAYCGVVSAGAGAGAGIAYLHGGGYEEISHTIVNALAITSGIVCDGAKPSCAAKISAAVDAGILGFEMFRSAQQFYSGDGLVAQGVEDTIKNFCRLGRVGMKETDREIIRMMTENMK